VVTGREAVVNLEAFGRRAYSSGENYDTQRTIAQRDAPQQMRFSLFKANAARLGESQIRTFAGLSSTFNRWISSLAHYTSLLSEFTETAVGLGGHRTPTGGRWHNLGYAFYTPRYRSWWAL